MMLLSTALGQLLGSQLWPRPQEPKEDRVALNHQSPMYPQHAQKCSEDASAPLAALECRTAVGSVTLHDFQCQCGGTPASAPCHLSGFRRILPQCPTLCSPAPAHSTHSRLHLRDSLGQPPARGEEQSHRELSGGIGQDVRGVTHADPPARKAPGSAPTRQRCRL